MSRVIFAYYLGLACGVLATLFMQKLSRVSRDWKRFSRPAHVTRASLSGAPEATAKTVAANN